MTECLPGLVPIPASIFMLAAGSFAAAGDLSLPAGAWLVAAHRAEGRGPG